MITLQDIRSNPCFQLMIDRACDYLLARGYTEHGVRHVTYVAKTTAYILAELGFDSRTVELGAIAGYLHDVGNMHNRKYHGITGANLVYTELRRWAWTRRICDITMPLLIMKKKLALRHSYHRSTDHRRQERCPPHRSTARFSAGGKGIRNSQPRESGGHRFESGGRCPSKNNYTRHRLRSNVMPNNGLL